jgi:hypothetical protein
MFTGLGLLVAGWALAQSPAAAPGTSVVKNWNFTLQKQGQTQGRFRGGKAVPVNGLRAFDVEQFHVDTFRSDGELDLTAESPACRVVLTNDSFVVSSPDALRVVQADGRFELTGEGFHWDHGAQRLVVSNRVKTLLKLPLPRRGPDQ